MLEIPNFTITMIAFLKKHWFFVGIAVVSALAFAAPGLGVFAREYKILNYGIFLTFLITGFSLDTRSVLEQVKNFKVLATSLLSALLVIPIITAVLAALFFGDNIDFIIGSIIMAVAPVTVASGTVMTAMAMGNVPLSLFICVLCNLFSLLTIPLVLNGILGVMGDMMRLEQAVTLPVGRILVTLGMTVLLPTVLGQILRPWIREHITPYKKAFSIFSQAVVLLIIFNAVSGSVGAIGSVGLGFIGLFGFMIGLHALILALNFGISRGIRLDQPSTAAFTIHTSQKTLTVSYLVWAGYFAQAFPLAMVPGIAYHLVQMVMDVFVADWFRKRAERRTR